MKFKVDTLRQVSYVYLLICLACVLMYCASTQTSCFSVLKPRYHQTSLNSLVSVQRCETNIDLCLIVDSSGSIRENNPDHGRWDNWRLLLGLPPTPAWRIYIRYDHEALFSTIYTTKLFSFYVRIESYVLKKIFCIISCMDLQILKYFPECHFFSEL